MKFFNNRAVALVLAVLVVLGSTAANVNRHLARRAEAVEAIWEENNGIARQLKYRCSAAAQFYSVAQNYGELAEVSATLRDAYNAVYDASTPEEKYVANERLAQAAEAAWRAVESADTVAASDREDMEYYYSLLVNAQRVIGQSTDYNDAVTEYRTLVRSFPAALLRPMIFVEEPGYFAP